MTKISHRGPKPDWHLWSATRNVPSVLERTSRRFISNACPNPKPFKRKTLASGERAG